VRELSHAEAGVYLVGMRSYGRAPTFLAMTGYEQVPSIAAAITGDTEAADRVELAAGHRRLRSSGRVRPGRQQCGCGRPPEPLTIGRPEQS
jgi:hypothetical protein